MLKELRNNKSKKDLIKKFLENKISENDFLDNIYPWAIIDYMEFSEPDGTHLAIDFGHNQKGQAIYTFVKSKGGTSTSNMVTYRNIRKHLKAPQYKINKEKLERDCNLLIFDQEEN